ncbi:hypothetical protein [Larkinella soli]|uniref:hypothetical protein n=1 Tax=Larkinella soli TaxID=1770527 RepID=UPI000FFB1D77|nr:hypothetical protein [Larkinella soli]
MKNLLKLGVTIDCAAVLLGVYDALADAFAWPGAISSHGTLLVLLVCTGLLLAVTLYLKSSDGLSFNTLTARLPAFPLLGFGLAMLLIVALKPAFRHSSLKTVKSRMNP